MTALLKGIGKQIQVGIAKEATRGTTPAAASYWLAVDDWEIEERFANATDLQTYGVIEDNVGQTRTKNWAEGTLKAPLGGTTSAILLYSLFGTVTTVLHSGETLIYDNTLAVGQSVQHQSLSFYVHDPIPTASGATADYSHANGVVHKATIEYTLGKFVEGTYSLKALKGSAAAVVFSPSQIQEPRFVPQYLTFKTASTYAGLGAASAIKIKSAKIDIDSNSEDDDVLGSTAPRDFLNKEFKIEGTIEAIWQNESDFKANSLANTPQAMRLDMVNSDVTIGVAANPQLRLDLAKVYFTEFSRPVKIAGVMYQTVKFKAAYSLTDAFMAKLLIVNSISVASQS